MLSAGQKLGRYEILAALGAGGMGEVYRARDTELRRDVALKLLPEKFCGDPDRVKRFEREARATAALVHPNVLTVFDVGHEADRTFLVFEMLEGLTLEMAMKEGRLPARDVLEYGTQIARGLAAAHAAGIVHRDLKPANLLRTATGVVKIIDFGLARVGPIVADPEQQTTEVTVTGAALGTVSYMSPEQAKGLATDGRSDIFSLGVVLYEMLSGYHPFRRASAAETVSALLRDDPPEIVSLEGVVSVALSRLVRRCLAKRAEDRFHTANDLALALDLLARGEGASPPVSPQPAPAAGEAARFGRPLLAGLGLALVLVSAASIWGVVSRTTRERVAAESLPVRVTSFEGAEFDPAFSPDERRLAFVWNGPDGGDDLYVQTMDGTDYTRLTRSGSICCPAWSPDGSMLAFVRMNENEGTLMTIPAAGGEPRRLGRVGSWLGLALAWSPDGRRIVYPNRTSVDAPFGLVSLSLDTLRVDTLTRPDAAQLGDAFPAWSPDGKKLAFARVSAMGDSFPADVYVLREGDASPHRVTFDATLIGGLGWSADGRHLLYGAVRKGDDPRVWRVSEEGGASPSPLAGVKPTDLVVVTPFEVSHDLRLAVSRRSGRIAYVRGAYDTNIWVMPNPRSGNSVAARRAIASTLPDESPQYSPDGKTIAFSTARSGHEEIWTCGRDGRGCAALTKAGVHSGTPRWSPDGRSIAFDSRPENQSDIFVIDVATRAVRRITSSPADDVVPSWSADGRTIYFASNRTGTWQVWRVDEQSGSSSPLTTSGGFAAFEKGDTVYFTKQSEPGLWRVSKGGGEPMRVASGPRCWGQWAVASDGIYILDSVPDGHTSLDVLDFDAPAPVRVGTFDFKTPCAESSLAISPDGRDLAYVATEKSADIMMVDAPR